MNRRSFAGRALAALGAVVVGRKLVPEVAPPLSAEDAQNLAMLRNVEEMERGKTAEAWHWKSGIGFHRVPAPRWLSSDEAVAIVDEGGLVTIVHVSGMSWDDALHDLER